MNIEIPLSAFYENMERRVFTDYPHYKFGYISYAQLEQGDTLTDIYRNGFLPMSQNNTVKKQFYESRSFRVPLETFTLTSENRRVLRQWTQHPERMLTPISQFDFADQKFQDFCKIYLKDVLHLNGQEKLSNILETNLITDVVTYISSGEVQGYVFLIQDTIMTHYWFSFYALAQIKKSFGVYMMVQEIQAAKDSKKQYIYLGTCYGAKGKYKTNFRPFEYWNGAQWIQDEKKIKTLLSKE